MQHNSPDPNQPKVHVVDDNVLVLESVTAMIRSAGWTAIPHNDVGGFQARLTPDECGCECALLDLRMPGVQGLSLLRELNASHPWLPVIMMSGHADIPSAMEALRCGALDFLVKPFRREELLDRVAKAVEIALVEHVNRTRVREIQHLIAELTPRETEVMELLRRGQSVKKIGFDLGVSHKTIQVHRSSILDAMRVASVVELTNLLHEMESLQTPFRPTASTTDRGQPRDSVARGAVIDQDSDRGAPDRHV